MGLCKFFARGPVDALKCAHIDAAHRECEVDALIKAVTARLYASHLRARLIHHLLAGPAAAHLLAEFDRFVYYTRVIVLMAPKNLAKFNALNTSMMTREDGGPQRRRLGILLAYHPPREEEGGSRREKWGAGLSQLGFGLGKILTSRSADDSCIEGIGNSPHVVQEVAKEGAAAGLLRPGDEVAALDGKNVASMDYKAVRELLAEVCGRKENISVTVIRRQQGDNWGATSTTLNFNIPLTLQGPAPTLVDEQLVHSCPSLPPSRPPSLPPCLPIPLTYIPGLQPHAPGGGGRGGGRGTKSSAMGEGGEGGGWGGGGGVKGSGMDFQHFWTPRTGAGMQGMDDKGDGILVGTDTGGLGSSGAPHRDNYYSTQVRSDLELIPSTPISATEGGNEAHTRTARVADDMQACPLPRVSVKADWDRFERKSRCDFSIVLFIVTCMW
jgi:hypothetical protein